MQEEENEAEQNELIQIENDKKVRIIDPNIERPTCSMCKNDIVDNK